MLLHVWFEEKNTENSFSFHKIPKVSPSISDETKVNNT